MIDRQRKTKIERTIQRETGERRYIDLFILYRAVSMEFILAYPVL